MTQRLWTRVLGGLLAALAVASPASAEEKRPPQPYIVLVGISNYADKQIKSRPHAEEDVKALYDVFTNKEYLGAPAANVKLLLGAADPKRPSEIATRDNILKALKWVVAEAKSTDLVVFAFIGEGGPLGESGDRRCYFAADSTVKGRDKDAVEAGEIGDILKNLKSQRFASIIDVDFKGFTGPALAVAEPNLGASPYKEFLGDDGSDDHIPLPGRVVFLATNGLTTSLDGKDHGIFTAAILAGLKGEADKEGYEPDGVVTVDELTEYLDKKMPGLAREFGKTKAEKEQIHFVLGGRGNHYILTHNPKVVAKVDERVEKFAALVKDGKVPEKFAAEGKKLLERMPRLESQRQLRKAYQALADAGDLEKFESARADILAKTKLSREDALEFAKHVVEVSQMAAENYVKDTNQGELVARAIRGIYRRIDEKIPAEIEERLKGVKDLKDAELTVLVADVRQLLGNREDLDKHKDIDIALQRMLNSLDPYTTYIDPEQLERFKTEIGQQFTGIGIQIRKDSASDRLVVVTPIMNSPAYKKGLLAGDIVTTITRDVDSDGKTLTPPEVIDTKGLMLSDAVKKILGKKGTKVKLTVEREGAAAPLEFVITRGLVEVETVLGFQRQPDDEWDFMIDEQNKIGYVRLSSFSKNTFRDLSAAMRKLTAKGGIRGFILDLRFNPGGLLTSAFEISDLYVDDGLIVSIRPHGKKEREQKMTGKHEGSLLNFPMVCMVNGYSASGSEIVSAALQDHKRAYIIGERSYGKGSVQHIVDYDGGQIKMTMATFWPPSGRNLNKSSTSGKDEDEWGVTPDKIVKLSRKEREDLAEAQRASEIIQRRDAPTKEPKPEFKDRQLEEALSYLRGQIKTASRGAAGKAG